MRMYDISATYKNSMVNSSQSNPFLFLNGILIPAKIKVVLDHVSKTNLYIAILLLVLFQSNMLLGQCSCANLTLIIGDDDTDTYISTLDWESYSCLQISGTLVIDEETTWDNITVQMLAESSIRVEADFYVINGTHMINCSDFLWLGIKTTSFGKLTLSDCIIQGANYGVELVNFAEYSITNVDFIDDFVGITAGDPFEEDEDFIKVSQEGQISGCTFFTDGPSLPKPYVGHPYYDSETTNNWPLNNGGVEFDRMYAAVFIRNCAGLSVGGAIGTDYNEVFDARNGIISLNSETYVIRTMFHDFTGQFPSPDIHDPTINQVAIYSYRSHITIERNMTEEVHVGVWGIESTNFIRNNELGIFNGQGRIASTKGIHQERPQNLNIVGNKIYNGYKGIWVDNGTRPFTIDNNYLERFVDRIENEAIRVDGDEVLGSVMSLIHNNDILIDNGNSSIGIILSDVTGIKVDYNHIDFVASIEAGQENAGIAVFNGTACVISKNVITADPDYNNEVTDPQFMNIGLGVLNSKMTTLHCNEMENFDNDMWIIGTNNLTSISSNFFGDANRGYEIYGPSRLGIQFHKGNQWLGEFDEWGAVVTGQDVVKTAQLSAFIVDGGDLSGVFIPSSYDPEDLFIDQEGLAYSCFQQSDQIKPIGLDMSAFIREDFEFSRFDDEMKWLAYADLYDILLKHDSLLTYYALDSFFTMKEVEALGELMQIRDNLSRIPNEQIATKLALEGELSELTNDLMLIDSIVDLNPIDKLDWLDLRGLKCDTIRDTMEFWIGILDVEMQDFIIECEDALTDLSGVTNTNDLEEYLKVSLQMRATLTIDGYLSSGDSTDVSDMRELCPWRGGYAVGMVNDVFAEITDSVAGHRIYTCLSPEPLISSSDLNNNNPSQILVSPNPANDCLNIESVSAISEIKLFDSAFKLVFRRFPNENCYTLDVENLSPGLYLLNVIQGNEVHTLKIVVSR